MKLFEHIGKNEQVPEAPVSVGKTTARPAAAAPAATVLVDWQETACSIDLINFESASHQRCSLLRKHIPPHECVAGATNTNPKQRKHNENTESDT